MSAPRSPWPVEFACHELDMSMVDENRKTSLKLKPSPALVAQIAEGCRHARAAVAPEERAGHVR